MKEKRQEGKMEGKGKHAMVKGVREKKVAKKKTKGRKEKRSE